VVGLIGSPARISAGRVDGQVTDSVGRLRELRADSVPGRALSAGTKRLTTWVPCAETQNKPAHQSVGKEKEPGARGGWKWVGPAER
jgi:hypothetical protein